MAATFDFAPDTHVAEELAPEVKPAVSMNGWEFTATPNIPYRPKWRLLVGGMRWHLNGAGNALDLVTDPQHNAGRLAAFYREHQTWKPFDYVHEYLGSLSVRFAEPVNIPKALANANGLIPEFEVMLVHHNPSF